MASADAASATADLVVIGSTPGGIAMAVRAAREGLSVLLVNRHGHLGGMLASGLSVWDTRHEGRRAPVYDEIRAAILAHYRDTYGTKSQQYRDAVPGTVEHGNGKFESFVAERAFTALVRGEPNIAVLTFHCPIAVERVGREIAAVVLRRADGGATLRARARIFADCTYEGDVMALAGIAHRCGREAREAYGEAHAGRIFMRRLAAPLDREHAATAARHAALRLRPFRGTQARVEGAEAASGAAMRSVQAMNYRVVLSADPANRVAVDRPAGYDPARYRDLEFASLIEPVPNRKSCWNRPQLLDLQTEYVTADWPRRQRIMDAHWEAALGLLYYLQNDAPLAAEERARWRAFGLARDEFADNANRPYEIYVREARRLHGRATFTEHDTALAPGTLRTPIHRDSVGITEWYIDSHACGPERVADSLREGVLQLTDTTFPGQVPFRCLLPPDADNLLVPVCLSASHVGWQAVRLEATWMNVAESAAVAAALACRSGRAPATLAPDALARAIARRRIMTTFFNDVAADGGEDWVPAVQYFGTAGFFPSYDAAPDRLLTRAVATAWIAALAAMSRPDYDADRTARRVLAAEQETDSPAIAGAELGAMASRAGAAPASSPPGSGAAISRAAACALLFAALPDEG